MEEGGKLDHDHVHDVTALIKKFFRDLPEMILGDKEMQNTLKQCLQTGFYASRCIRLTLLMLPPLHLYTLVSFLQLLKQISEFENKNKMNAYALAVVVAPSLMPVIENNEAGKIGSFVQIIKILIEDAKKVGIIPQRTLARYCLKKKKSRYILVLIILLKLDPRLKVVSYRPIQNIPDDNEKIVLYFFLNGRFCLPYKYKTCVGSIKAKSIIKSTKKCCNNHIMFHNFRYNFKNLNIKQDNHRVSIF